MRWLKRLFIFVLLVLLLVALAGIFVVRRSFPEMDGEIKVGGLKAPVKIVRDEFGIPNIYASSQEDLFFAQGYVHAQDRFWQMDFWRHTGAGRLSEMFGSSQVQTDRVLRTMGWARVVEEQLKQTDPVSLAILNTYTHGINAYMRDHTGSKLAVEYAILGLINRGYSAEPWKPQHSLTWGKAMAWDLGSNMYMEIMRSILLKSLTPEKLADIFPPYPQDRPFILPGETQTVPIIAATPQVANVPQILLERMAEGIKPSPDGIGSNNWVISGSLTTTGKPLLANDPHLGAQMPSIWYQVGLHCEPKTSECPYDVAGFSFAGVPGVIIGHNDRIAWGFTNVGPDVQDLYIERTNPANKDQYEVNGTWVDMEKISETIRVAGGEPQTVIVRKTRHGPVMSDAYSSLIDFDKRSGVPLPASHVIAMRWTALEPSVTFPAIWKMNLARNWQEFRKAAAEFDVPSQNMVYADVDGNIGYQVPGKIPIRPIGDGQTPVPGWTGEYDWTGYIPFEELPNAFNPAQGYIASANNAVSNGTYKHFIALDWDYGSRAQRIVEMIEQNRGRISIETMKQIQGDNKNLNAQELVPYIQKLQIQNARLQKARALFDKWDFQQHMDLPAPALFESFWKHFIEATFQDDLPENYQPSGGSRTVEVMRRLVRQPDGFWWDDHRTNERETMDQILQKAFASAVEEMETLQGPDPVKWRWGRMHTITFQNETLGRSGVRPIEMLLNRGPFETSGGTAVVNATAWYATSGYQVSDLPSMRMIIDLGNLENSLSIHTTGQSGHPYHRNYIDMADPWRRIEYVPFRFQRSSIESSAAHTLTLK